MRAENVEFTRRRRALPRLGVDFESRADRPSRRDESAGRDRGGRESSRSRRERLRDAVAQLSPWARCAASARSIDGIVIWNDCYNSNPEAAQSMLDVLRETPARAAHRGAGRNAGTGPRGRRIAPAGGPLCGRRAPGVDLLIGVRGAARAMVEAAAAGGRARRSFSKIRPRPANGPARWRVPATRCCSRVRAACRWKGRWKGFWRSSHALLPALRTALQVRQPAPRLPLHHLAHRVRQPDGAVPVHRAGAVADRQAARVSDRPVHSRRRPQVAPEEGRHADHGRRADHHLDRGSDAAVGRPALSLRLDRARWRCWASAGSASSTITPRSPSSAIWASRAGASWSTSSWWDSAFAAVAAVHARVRRFQHGDERSVLQAASSRRC